MNTQTPSDPRAQLRALSAVLRRLHKTLVENEMAHFGPAGSAFDQLQLLTSHPQFAWLRQISEILVEIDERLDDKEQPADAAAVQAYKTLIERQLTPDPEAQTEFQQKYLSALQDSPTVAMAHGELRRQLAALPGA
ncbi:MAG: hypothetical protein E6560_03755 [Yersiniaceae bacterium]|uniref:Uncharacterized protein n=1 Tax=Chimaeribacter coloradensis TaxID=2060068 RepID=A0A2N5DW66_9GAMM|nr:hypothetical protein [Chimaeribacter coloradensis]MDU6410069.1 hypothetical protein [Yersiniaceae bacterium]PLR31350.1 hypothetical protein CYR32_17225 [Chimaeribacter coloradensis]